MVRTVVSLFQRATEAQQALTQLLAAGFQRSNINLATRATLRAAHLPGAAEAPAPAESFEESIVRFFTDLFADNENAETQAQARLAAASPDSAVITVNTGSEEEAERARGLLAGYGAVDVYKQTAAPGYAPPRPTLASNIIDLEGSLARVRGDDGLDANGLTAH